MEYSSSTLLLCRLCLRSPGKLNLFQQEYLSDDIQLYLGIKVCPSDNLPKEICTTCNFVIEDIKKLRALALHNDCYLKRLYRDVEHTVVKLENVEGDAVKLENVEGDAVKLENVEGDAVKLENVEGDAVKLENVEGDAVKLEDCDDNDCANNSVISSSESGATSECTAAMIHDNFDPKEQKHSYSYVINDVEDKSIPRFYSVLLPENKVMIKRKSDIKDECYECPRCFKIYSNYKKFYLHQQSHLKRFLCSVNGCNKTFACKNDLMKHLVVHTGEKPYECRVCFSRFTQKGTLKNHIEKQHGDVELQTDQVEVKYKELLPT